MNFSPEVYQQLLVTFQSELTETTNEMTNTLVELEKADLSVDHRQEMIDKVCRAAHNLKGASRGLGIVAVGSIAHHMESIFSALRTNHEALPSLSIDICLEAVDGMKAAMQAFVEKSELPFNLNDLLQRIDQGQRLVNSAVNTPSKINEQTSNVIHDEPSQESIRVSLKVIDKLSELSEEVQVNKIQIDDFAAHTKSLNHLMKEFQQSWHHTNKLINANPELLQSIDIKKSLHHTNDAIITISNLIQTMKADISAQANDYGRLTQSIVEEVSQLRLIPAHHYLMLLPRYIRELSTELCKQVDLEITGDEVHIDKIVIEGLKDPINHILRNAVDHGIEVPEQRVQSGKSKIGKIKINVKDAGHNIYFEISDDGAGLDYEKIKQKLREQNHYSSDKKSEFSDDELQQSIFKSGFSTKDVVSDISGRGVGMDVVKRNIQNLKGSISIHSIRGKGTTFILCVPLSLSSERGVIVQCEDQIFVLPTSNIDRIQLCDPNDIVHIEGSQAILIDNHPIILKPLANVLEMNQYDDTKQSIPIIILRFADYVIALAVDKIIGEREIVIKPIQNPLTNIPFIAGATLLDRNKIALVLNPEELIHLALNTPNSRPYLSPTIEKNVAGSIHILVVDDSITTRTLEKNILESKNYHVTTAVNGQEAWDILQKKSFSLIITDVNMPIMDGFELTSKIKHHERLSSIPVIIVTSLNSYTEKAKGIEAGADAYIVKNEFESGNLLQLIDQLV